MTPAPAHVDVSLSEGVSIVWRDGHTSHYAIAALRAACPCAGCQDLHGEGRQPEPAAANPLRLFQAAPNRLLEAKPVGRYALQFRFSDGHDTGIFTWEYLRSLCACDACRAEVSVAGRR
jgi:DUF971 family protein